MTVLEAIKLNIYTLRTLRSDESAVYITLGRTSDISARGTDGDDLRSAGIWMDGDDFFMSNRRTTFQIDTRVRPVRLCSRALDQSACVHSNICATFAGTVVDHASQHAGTFSAPPGGIYLTHIRMMTGVFE